MLSSFHFSLQVSYVILIPKITAVFNLLMHNKVILLITVSLDSGMVYVKVKVKEINTQLMIIYVFYFNHIPKIKCELHLHDMVNTLKLL